MIKEQMKNQPMQPKDESFWAKKWIKGAKNNIKDFKVPNIGVPNIPKMSMPKLPPMPSANQKQPEIIQEAPADLDIQHETGPPKVQSLMDSIDEQQIESTPPS